MLTGVAEKKQKLDVYLCACGPLHLDPWDPFTSVWPIYSLDGENAIPIPYPLAFGVSASAPRTYPPHFSRLATPL